MKTLKLILVVLLLLTVHSAIAQQPVNNWTKWKHLLGTWVGEGNGQPGQETGSFSFKTDLDSNILVRKNHTVFPATSKKPASVHDDLMIIYPDTSGNPAKAIYFDNEGHTINYLVSYTDSSIVLTSEVSPNSARFRLSYVKIDSKKVNVRFEIALPPDHAKFVTYLEGKALKKN